MIAYMYIHKTFREKLFGFFQSNSKDPAWQSLILSMS